MQVRILKRSSEEAEVTAGGSAISITHSSHKTLAEREEDYACARLVAIMYNPFQSYMYAYFSLYSLFLKCHL